MIPDRIESTEYPNPSGLQQQQHHHHHQEDRYRHQLHRPELESVTESNSQEGDLVNATDTATVTSHDSPITLARLSDQEDHDGVQEVGSSSTGQRESSTMFDAGVSPGTRMDPGAISDARRSNEVVNSTGREDGQRQ
jgi:hypothetical protein